MRWRRPRIRKVRLHKLLYYVQGYHLAWQGEPAFPDDIEAWESGPVVASLWHAENCRGQGRSATRPRRAQLATGSFSW
ncbi:MAG: SocA family protein [Acidimicrobiia bacterium]|nr:SocA family protein [Acidimicrobiia bacterium]